jgi:hypothetical protein
MFTFSSNFMQKRLFYQIDCLSPSPILYVFKEKRRPSYLGVILTILMIAVTIIFSASVLYKFFGHKSYSITYNKINLLESSSFNIKNTLFAFKILSKGYDYYDYEFNLVTYYYNNETESKMKINSTDCIFSSEYICLNDNNLDNLTNELNSKEIYLSFEINNKTLNEEIKIEFLFNIPKIDHDNFTNPIHYLNYTQKYIIPINQLTSIDNYFKMINYQTKTGIISTKISELNISFYDESIMIKELTEKNNSTKGIIKFHVSPFNVDTYLRTYPTVQELLSQIGGITSIVFRGFSIFMAFFASTKNNYVIFSHIVNKHNESNKKKITFKDNNNNYCYNNFTLSTDNDSIVPKLRKPFLNSNSEEKNFNSNQSKQSNKKDNIEIELANYNNDNDNDNNKNNEENKKKKKSLKKRIIKNGNLAKISLCNSFCIQIMPCKTKNKKILSLSEEFIRDCLGIENIIKTNCRMNQMFKLLNPDKKMKVDGIDDHIIESLKIIENGGDVLPLNNDTLEE